MTDSESDLTVWGRFLRSKNARYEYYNGHDGYKLYFDDITIDVDYRTQWVHIESKSDYYLGRLLSHPGNVLLPLYEKFNIDVLGYGKFKLQNITDEPTQDEFIKGVKELGGKLITRTSDYVYMELGYRCVWYSNGFISLLVIPNYHEVAPEIFFRGEKDKFKASEYNWKGRIEMVCKLVM